MGQDIQLLKADYYDYYAFLDDEELLPENRQEYGKVYPDTQKPDAAGLKTGTASYAADGSGTLTGMEVLYYDSFGRCVQKRLKNHLGETDEEYTAYTFTGLPRLVMRVHRSPDQEERKEMLRYEYDTMDRLLKVYFRLDDKEEELVCDNVYDDLGRVVVDRRNGTDNLRTGYTYNIRNWMTSIESPLFKEELHYTDGTGTPCYNGNISSISWKAGEEQTTRGYRFTYDGLDRMKKAEYGEGERLAVNPNRFNEEVTAYDKTGNILGIRRMGQTGAQEYGLVDNLALTYSGNQLTKVTDNAASSAYNNGFEFKDGADKETEYTYDENGNLTQDLNRNIKDIQYNFLNLPQRIEFEDGSTTEYLYDAEGRKLRTLHKADGKTTTTDYAGNLIYENGNPARLLTGYGYVSLLDGMYHYYLQDHLGNNRVVADRNGKVEEVNHYYPFGGMFPTTGNIQPYKYNGKELDTRKGLNWYDYGARYYDPALGRFTVVDSVAEKHYYASPYIYCNNLPMRYIDPDGNDWKDAYPHLENAISANVSIGWRLSANFQVWGAKVGIDADAGSVKIGNDGIRATKGASIDLGIGGAGTYQEAYEINDKYSALEEGTSWNFLMLKETTNKTTIYDSTGKYFKEVHHKEEKKEEITAGGSAAIGIGFEVSINLKEIYNFFTDLFK